MAVNDEIVNRATQHQIRLVRLANNSVRRLNAAITRAQREIAQLIAALSTDPTTKPEQIVAALRQALNRQTPLFRAAIEEELRGLPPYEAQATIRMIDGALPQNVSLNFEEPTAEQLAAVLEEPLAGKTIDEWFVNLTDAAFDRFRSAVRIGFLEGQTTGEIVSNVRDTFEIQRSNAEAVTRTLMMTLAQRSRQLVFDQNADLFVGLTWRATLDPRTCPICQERDGQVFPVDKGPRPPAHVACRCVCVAALKDADKLGLPPSTRASMNGQVPDTTTYGEWLAAQKTVIQDEVLGKKRGQLFRDGHLAFDHFFNDQGMYYTLAELEQRERAAWNRAGL